MLAAHSVCIRSTERAALWQFVKPIQAVLNVVYKTLASNRQCCMLVQHQNQISNGKSPFWAYRRGNPKGRRFTSQNEGSPKTNGHSITHHRTRHSTLLAIMLNCIVHTWQHMAVDSPCADHVHVHVLHHDLLDLVVQVLKRATQNQTAVYTLAVLQPCDSPSTNRNFVHQRSTATLNGIVWRRLIAANVSEKPRNSHA